MMRPSNWPCLMPRLAKDWAGPFVRWARGDRVGALVEVDRALEVRHVDGDPEDPCDVAVDAALAGHVAAAALGALSHGSVDEGTERGGAGTRDRRALQEVAAPERARAGAAAAWLELVHLASPWSGDRGRRCRHGRASERT